MAEENDREHEDDALEGGPLGDEEGLDEGDDLIDPAEEARLAALEQAEIARENAELHENAAAAPMGMFLGPERWIQFSFIAIALVVFYVADALIGFTWIQFAEPDPTIVTAAAAVIGILVGYLLYRNERTNELASEVVYELAKVTWPTREETYYSTIVVIVTSIVAALYTGAFDAVWAAVTDYIYNL